MPVLRRFDFTIGGKGFMLARGQYKGRAWLRMGTPDSPGSRSQTAAQWGALPDELDHPEVWDDWSGGYGHAYRRAGENGYHWGENFDSRFPRQLTHAQNPVTELGFEEQSLITDSLPPGLNPYNKPGGSHTIMFIRPLTPGPGGSFYGSAHTMYPTDTSGRSLSSNDAPNTYLNWSPGVRPAMWGSFHLIPTTAATCYQFNAVGSVYALALRANGFVVAGGRLWRWFGKANNEPAYALRSIADAAASLEVEANWSATLYVGSGEQPINDIIEIEGQLFCGKPDGLYAGDLSGTFVNVLGELSRQVHRDNCRDLLAFRGGVITSHVGGLLYYRQNEFEAQVQDITPIRNVKGIFSGKVRAVATHGRWLYAGVSNASYSQLLASDMETNPPRWHPLQRLPNARINRVFIDGVTMLFGGSLYCPQRMWVACEASGTTFSQYTYRWPIPPYDGNPLLSDTSFTPNYIGSARIDLGSVDWGAPGTPKLYRAVEVWADNLASGAQWCNLYYTVDNEGTRHLLGTVATSPKDTLYFGHAEGSFITGQSIELSLESFTASAAITPIYRSIILRGALQPRSVDLITAKVRIADGVVDRMGAEMRSGATMLKDLRDFGDVDVSGGQAYQLVDLAGATAWVKVVGRIEEEEYYQAGDDNPEIAATVRMAVLDYE